MSLAKIQHQNLSMTEGYSYGGIPILSTDGIHEKSFTALEAERIPKNSAVLILGAGAGAFDKRLLDNDYTNITSVEFVEGTHKVSGVTLLQRDLNDDFSDLGHFKAIIALEIIEHLENQFHFLRQIENILEKDGLLILSSPNVENNFSRLKFFLSGKLEWFGGEELFKTGHINPIFSHIFQFNLSRTKLYIVKKIENKSIWFGSLFKHKHLKIKVMYVILYLLSFFSLKKDSNDINIFLIKKGH